MSRSKETYNKKEVRNKKEKKRKQKAEKRQAKKEQDKKSSLDDMIAYVDEFGNITSTPPDPDKKTETKLEDIETGPPKQNKEDIDPIRNGIVDFFNDSKGYGFIRDIETRESVFVHVNDINEEIREGNKVEFEVEQGKKGPVAVRVKIIK